MTQQDFRRRSALAAVLAGLALTAACGGDDGGTGAASTTTGGATSAAATSASETASEEPEEVCPLLDPAMVADNFGAADPQFQEKEPTESGPATVFACDVSDGGQLLLTAGVSVGPPSGSAEANLRAALEGKDPEPVDGVGELGGYAETDGVGTVAGVVSSADRMMVVFVHGNPSNKEQLVALAQDFSQKV